MRIMGGTYYELWEVATNVQTCMQHKMDVTQKMTADPNP